MQDDYAKDKSSSTKPEAARDTGDSKLASTTTSNSLKDDDERKKSVKYLIMSTATINPKVSPHQIPSTIFG